MSNVRVVRRPAPIGGANPQIQYARNRRATPQKVIRTTIQSKSQSTVKQRKSNSKNEVAKNLEVKPKLIRIRDIDAYKRQVKPVSQRPVPVHEQLKVRQPPLKKVDEFKARSRSMIRQEIKKPRTNIVEGQSHKFIEKVRALRNVGEGRVLIMIACGPSVLEAPLELLVDHPLIDFMAINKPYGYYKNQVPKGHDRIWPARYWCFCDHSQFRRNSNAWENYRGLLINSPAVRARHPKQVVIRHRPGKGFSRDMTVGYHIGRSSTYANMQVAYWLGYDKIYIFGLDMTDVGGKLHHYGKNPDVSEENRKKRFQAESEYYSYAAQNMTENERKKYIICSSYNPYNFVDSFERLHQKKAPQIILDRLDQK